MKMFKFFVADVIDKIYPNACWADLATWAVGVTSLRDVDFSGKCTRAPNFNKACGGCYCGKHRTPEAGDVVTK